MKLTRYLCVAAFAALALAGCTTLDAAASTIGNLVSPTGSVATVAPAAMSAAKKALTAMHALHEAAADALSVAASTPGGLKPGSADALTARQWLDTSEAYLTAADKLVALGDATGIEAKVGAAGTLIAQVQSLIGAH